MNHIVIKNAIWMLSEKFFSIIGTLIVTIMTARYLGAEKTGFLTYMVTLFAFLVPLANLGIQNLIFDRTSKNKKTGERLIKATENFRTLVFIVFSIPFIIVGLMEVHTYSDLIIMLVIFLYTFYQSKDIYPAYFNAVLKSKVNVIANQVSLFLSQLVRASFVFINAPFFLFSIPYIVLTGVAYYIKRKTFNAQVKNDFHSLNHCRKKSYKKYLMHAGFPLAISSISIMIYMRIGQIILANDYGMESVGYFNAASTLAQGWVFIPTVLITMLFNRVIASKHNRDKGFSTIFLYSSLVSLFAVVLFYFFGSWFVVVTFGTAFEPAKDIVFIIAMANMFGIWGLINYRIIITYGGFKFLLKKAVVVCLINVILTKYLIHEFGIHGAAYAIAITELLSATIANYFFRKGYIFRVNIKAVSSWLYIKHILH